MDTYQRGDRVRLRPEAPGSNYCRLPGPKGIISRPWLESDPSSLQGAGPVYLVFVGRGFGVMGTGYSLNTADELVRGWPVDHPDHPLFCDCADCADLW